MTNLAIATNGLRKSVDKVVRDGVPAVPEGTIFALLGPNGDHTLVSPGRST
jgi:hypothetical protein